MNSPIKLHAQHVYSCWGRGLTHWPCCSHLSPNFLPFRYLSQGCKSVGHHSMVQLTCSSGFWLREVHKVPEAATSCPSSSHHWLSQLELEMAHLSTTFTHNQPESHCLGLLYSIPRGSQDLIELSSDFRLPFTQPTTSSEIPKVAQ